MSNNSPPSPLLTREGRKEFDLAILGGGPGGYAAAIRAAQLGAKVVLIEQDKVGGTCLNRGCIPTKALIASTNFYERMQKAESLGLSATNISIDFAKVVARKNEVVAKLVKGLAGLIEKNGIEIIYGQGEVVAPGLIKINNRDVQSRAIILATGSLPASLPGVAHDGKKFICSDEALELAIPPARLDIIGGGVIGIHFAMIYSSLGTAITIYEAQPEILPGVDDEVVAMVKRLLKRKKIPHQVLNAKQHEKEAEAIAQAGKKGHVTVATNMAGRGVDIILGGNPQNEEEAEEIKKLGGLYVIGTERHESRRIDNQLRGRSGRQGDPGMTQFFVSLEDDLMRIFGSDKIRGLIQRLNLPEDQPVQNEFVSKALDSAQEKVEGANFDIRKYVLEYDDVLSRQRDAVYRRRKEFLLADQQQTMALIMNVIGEALDMFFKKYNTDSFDFENLWREIDSLTNLPASLKERSHSKEDLRNVVLEFFEQFLKTKEVESLRQGALRVLDVLWMEHLEAMDHLIDSVRLRDYAHHQPISEYKRESYQMFKDLFENFSLNLFIGFGRMINEPRKVTD